MKKILLLSLLIVLAGCSTEPVSPETAKEISPMPGYQKSADTTAITIVRDKGYVASFCAITAFVNGRKLADLNTGEKVVAYLPPGEVIVGAGFVGKGVCHGAPKKEREFIIKPNSPRALRIFIDQSGNVDILPTTKS